MTFKLLMVKINHGTACCPITGKPLMGIYDPECYRKLSIVIRKISEEYPEMKKAKIVIMKEKHIPL